jgi:elongation factor Ts
MTEITSGLVQELREKTQAGMMDCKKVLTEAEGDIEKAVQLLREKGLAKAAKRAGKATANGVVHSYIHMNGSIGVLVEVNCETDFVAKTDEFKLLAKDVAMHIAATNPLYVTPEEVPAAEIDKEKEIIKQQLLNDEKNKNKPEEILEKIIEGRIGKYYSEVCLLEQAFVKDPDKTVKDLLTETIAKLGENVVISRFSRFQLGT